MCHGDCIPQVENSVNDVTSLLDEKGNVSDKTIQLDNRTTVCSMESNEKRFVLLAIEKAKDQKLNEFRDQRNGS